MKVQHALVEQRVAKLQAIICALPPLPAHLSYVDEHDDSIRTIKYPAQTDIWQLTWDTQTLTIDLSVVQSPDMRFVVKWYLAWLLKNGSPHSVEGQWYALRAILREQGDSWIRDVLVMNPLEWASHWELEIRPSATDGQALFIKGFLHFMSGMSLGAWHPGHRDFIRSLRFAWRASRYLTVLSGTSILTASEEGALIEYFDTISSSVLADKRLSIAELLPYCVLCLCYTDGLRPIQISRMPFGDLRIYEGNSGEPIAHFVVQGAKKRQAADKHVSIRRVKREWAGPFAEYHRRRAAALTADNRPLTASVKAFPLPLRKIGPLIADTIAAITGVRRTATDLRHSAAQRLADSGASVEEVAHFLGQSYWETSLIYFEASESQAEQINKALAISPVYREIGRVARTRTIDKARLLKLAPDNQIGALPHGIPISGIGGCGLGQSLCALNPGISCYNCRKFIPIDDATVHRQVVDDLRPVVRHFYDESRGDNQSPAFVQLRTSLSAAQKVAADIEAGETEEWKDTTHE